MARLRRLSGAEVAAILKRFGFDIASQRGSHAKLRRIRPAGGHQTLTIPMHDELDPGTLRAIIRQAARFISAEELHPHFWSE